MQWEDLPPSQNFEDRTGEPTPPMAWDPWLRSIGIYPARKPPEFLAPRENPGGLAMALGINDITQLKGGQYAGPTQPSPLAQLLMAPPQQAPIFSNDIIARLLSQK
jgi:hypothetical protein